MSDKLKSRKKIIPFFDLTIPLSYRQKDFYPGMTFQPGAKLAPGRNFSCKQALIYW